jgi:hypothetical protein
MSIPCRRLSPIAMTFALVALVIAGCGSDETTSPPTVTPTDEAPPIAPTGVAVTSQLATKFLLNWSDNGEPDLLGYHVYLYDPDPMRPEAYVSIAPGGLLDKSQLMIGAEPGTTFILRVSAVDISGNEGAWSDPFVYTFDPTPNRFESADPGPGDDMFWEDLPTGEGRLPSQDDRDQVSTGK